MTTWEKIVLELEIMKSQGISIFLEGELTEPEDVATACIMCEGSSYMRDYLRDEEGILRELHFDKVEDEEDAHHKISYIM